MNIGGGVNVINTQTLAHVDSGARINEDNAGADAAQSVLIAAGSDYSDMGVVATGSVGGEVGITPGADVSVLDATTKAYIDDRARVNARRDILVLAAGREDILSIAASGAGGGLVGVGGAVSVDSIDTTTHAFIGNADTRILLRGDKPAIRAEVERCMAIGKDCPGFIMAVGNHIPPNTPIDAAIYYNEVYMELRDR